MTDGQIRQNEHSKNKELLKYIQYLYTSIRK